MIRQSKAAIRCYEEQMSSVRLRNIRRRMQQFKIGDDEYEVKMLPDGYPGMYHIPRWSANASFTLCHERLRKYFNLPQFRNVEALYFNLALNPHRNAHKFCNYASEDYPHIRTHNLTTGGKIMPQSAITYLLSAMFERDKPYYVRCWYEEK